MTATKLITLACLAFCTTACGLVPTETTSQHREAAITSTGAKTTTDVVHEVIGDPPPPTPPAPITVSGKHNVVTVQTSQPAPPEEHTVSTHTRTTNDEHGTASDSYDWFGGTTIPSGVKLILFAIGLVMFVGAVAIFLWWLKRLWTAAKLSSPAVAAAGQVLSTADNAAGTIISAIDSHIGAAVTPEMNAMLNNLKAVAEKQRGKINAVEIPTVKP